MLNLQKKTGFALRIAICVFSASAWASPGCEYLNNHGSGMAEDLAVSALLKVYGSYEFNSQDQISIAISRKTGDVSDMSLLANSSAVAVWNNPSPNISYSYVSLSGTVGYGLDISGSRGGSVSYTITCVPAAPTLGGIAPSSGDGGQITLTGTGFYGATGVSFDKTPAPLFGIVSDTEIIVTVPPDVAADSPQVITVTTDAGTTTATDVTYTLNNLPPAESADASPASSPEVIAGQANDQTGGESVDAPSSSASEDATGQTNDNDQADHEPVDTPPSLPPDGAADQTGGNGQL